MTRYRMEGTSTAVGIPVAAYFIGLSLFALWLYSLLQPHYTPNPGLAAYKPPPATVIDYEPPTRLLAHHWQAPPSAEIESLAEEPKTTVAESKPERTIEVKEPKRPKTRNRDNPLNHYAASYRGYSSRYTGAAYAGYSGNRPF